MKFFTTLKTWAEMIKIEHTLFALPFAISSALLAVKYKNFIDINYMNFFWILLCMFGARSAGMSLNRIFDAKIDAKNPRTASREIPSGKISKTYAWIFVIASLAIFIYSAFQLPRLCQILLPIALLWLWLYSLMKRISFLSHLFLGTVLGGATLGAWIAITNEINLAAIYFSLAVAFWVCGFDIIYSTQDFEFDREQKLHSIPAKFGIENAIKISRFCHFLTPLFLYLTGENLGLGLIYKIGVLLVIIACLYEQRLVREGKVEKAFFEVNTWISVLVMIFVIAELANVIKQ